ncbi:MAG: cysteine hydrolase family protein [Chloroflexota bacterium]|nr:cysteine hydrolase family protein [Chloroflexota bacterium]
MSLPSFYDSSRVGKLFSPKIQAAVDAGIARRLPAASEDAPKVALVLVDMQVDFIHRDGALPVPGAIDDCRRVIDWIYRNVDSIGKIFLSLDSHYPLQIFFSTWWRDAAGNHPAPNTIISASDVEGDRWRPLYEAEWSRQYVAQLEAQHRKKLMIWPYHTMLGTVGHNLSPSLYEAICYHSAARGRQPAKLIKGSIPQTEHYSILEPEVKTANQPQGDVNHALLRELGEYDLIYLAGQAKSHCVLETVNSIMRAWAPRPERIKRLRILEDGMSSVVLPGIDFEAMADAAYQLHRDQGLTFTRTTEAIG